jgi:hypothetical protein
MAMSLDNALWLSGVVTVAVVLGLLLYRSVWRILPIFCAYVAWNLFSSVGAYAVLHYFYDSYFTVYFAESAVDSALQFGVLVELIWSVLRPLRASLPRSALAVVAGLVVAFGAAIWPFAAIPGFTHWPTKLHLMMQMQQTTSILRIVFFLALAGGSQLLSIGWRDRELQVATGLGFYSLVSVAVAVLHTHQTKGSQYTHLNQVEVAGYLCSLLYWVFSFATKETERREFSPQMQSLLLAVAGTARTTRIALADSAAAKKGKPGER